MKGVRAWRPEVAINLLKEAVGNGPVMSEGGEGGGRSEIGGREGVGQGGKEWGKEGVRWECGRGSRMERQKKWSNIHRGEIGVHGSKTAVPRPSLPRLSKG